MSTATWRTSRGLRPRSAPRGSGLRARTSRCSRRRCAWQRRPPAPRCCARAARRPACAPPSPAIAGSTSCRDGPGRRALSRARQLGQVRLEGRRVDELAPALTSARPMAASELAPALRTGPPRWGESAFIDDGLELRRDVLGIRASAARRCPNARCRGAPRRPERAVDGPPGEDLPEDDAERVEVAPPVHLLAARLLGRHVAELALEHARLLGEEARAGDAEVGDLHRALEREEDVLRGDVAVHDLEALARLRLSSRARSGGPWPPRRRSTRRATGECARPAGGARAHEAAEVAPLDVLHREELALVPAS